jgi:succinyl-CoA synthetase beta subunit
MNIHEHQAKRLLAEFGVSVPRGAVAYSVEEAVSAAKNLESSVYVVKAQIHAGGRGAGQFLDSETDKGGVRVVKTLSEVQQSAEEMLGKVLLTKQTGPEGRRVQRIYVEEGCEIESEFYLSLLVDRNNSCVTLIASIEGGMEIEEVAENAPEKIINVAIDATTGLRSHHARKVAFQLGLRDKQVSEAVNFLQAIYKAFIELDASTIEINPLVLNQSGNLVALDAKMNFDPNALYRQPEIEKLRDLSEEEPAEVEAAKSELNYVKLDGNIGCMVNGAGLAMATMDIIKLHGGEPANFLDVGGGATKERVSAAFKIIMSDINVKGILVNIFGGIMKCDIIADGVVAAANELGLKIPLVVRLEGTNVDLGKKIMANSGLPIISADNLGEAAEKIVAAVRGDI